MNSIRRCSHVGGAVHGLASAATFGFDVVSAMDQVDSAILPGRPARSPASLEGINTPSIHPKNRIDAFLKSCFRPSAHLATQTA